MRKTATAIAAALTALALSSCSTPVDTAPAAPSTTRTLSPPGTLDATYVAVEARLKDEGIPHMDDKMLEELAHILCDAKEAGLSTEARIVLLTDSGFDWTVDEAQRIDEELIRRTCK